MNIWRFFKIKNIKLIALILINFFLYLDSTFAMSPDFFMQENADCLAPVIQLKNQNLINVFGNFLPGNPQFLNQEIFLKPVMMDKSRTFTILKPDAVLEEKEIEIIEKFNENNFVVIRRRVIWWTKAEAEEFYAVHKERPFFKGLVEYMISGPIVALILEYEGEEEAWGKFREKLGKDDGSTVGSWRDDLGVSDSFENIFKEAKQTGMQISTKQYISWKVKKNEIRYDYSNERVRMYEKKLKLDLKNNWFDKQFASFIRDSKKGKFVWSRQKLINEILRPNLYSSLPDTRKRAHNLFFRCFLAGIVTREELMQEYIPNLHSKFFDVRQIAVNTCLKAGILTKKQILEIQALVGTIAGNNKIKLVEKNALINTYTQKAKNGILLIRKRLFNNKKIEIRQQFIEQAI
ncbi:MAG: nucleoside-diphosphate kinase [Candidatus Omnitrophota bacterium]